MSPKKIAKIIVQGGEISVSSVNGQDYISLTDMVKNFEGSKSLIGNWVTNKNTIEFLGLWEQINNAGFKLLEFQEFKNRAGSNNFSLSTQRWVEATKAIGIMSKSGKYGGTYAHKDIAFEFATWLSPEFKLYVIKEFQRMKEAEKEGLEWDVRRILTKINYRVHTTAVKEVLVPTTKLPKGKMGLLYADEAEMFNMIIFGIMSKDWKTQNPKKALGGSNIRDHASLTELTLLSNLESLNAVMIRDGLEKSERYEKLSPIS